MEKKYIKIIFSLILFLGLFSIGNSASALTNTYCQKWCERNYCNNCGPGCWNHGSCYGYAMGPNNKWCACERRNCLASCPSGYTLGSCPSYDHSQYVCSTALTLDTCICGNTATCYKLTAIPQGEWCTNTCGSRLACHDVRYYDFDGGCNNNYYNQRTEPINDNCTTLCPTKSPTYASPICHSGNVWREKTSYSKKCSAGSCTFDLISSWEWVKDCSYGCSNGSCIEAPVNCVVSSWSAWSSCSETCGGGTQSRSRTIITQPAYGGTACPTLIESRSCNTQDCPCLSYCSGSTAYYSGTYSSRICHYSSKNCNTLDGYYDTGNTRWIQDPNNWNLEIEQKEQIYRDYYCTSGDCSYNNGNTRWVNTGNTRFVPDGTSCNFDGNSCTSGGSVGGSCVEELFCDGSTCSVGSVDYNSYCNSAPVANITCTPSDCTVYKNDSLVLNNNSTDANNNISSSNWIIEKLQGSSYIEKANITYTGANALNNYSVQTTVLGTGTFRAKLNVVDVTSASGNTTKSFYINQDIIPAFTCSLNNVDFQACNSLIVNEGETVYLLDNSTPSQGGDIISRTWKISGTPNITGNQINPSFVLSVRNTTVELNVRDSNSKLGSIEQTINASFSLPEWNEVSPE